MRHQSRRVRVDEAIRIDRDRYKKAVGRERARYANTFTTVFSSDISMPGMTGPRRKDIKSVSAYVGTSPILL